MSRRVVYSRYHLTREQAIQRLEAARAILANTIARATYVSCRSYLTSGGSITV